MTTHEARNQENWPEKEWPAQAADSSKPYEIPRWWQHIRICNGSLTHTFKGSHKHWRSAQCAQSNWPEWEKSIWCELNQHEQVGTWELVDPPSGVNIVGSQIVLHYKLDKHGTIQEYKARVIAQGFSQIKGINYSETFSPMAKLTAIWIIIFVVIYVIFYLI